MLGKMLERISQSVFRTTCSNCGVPIHVNNVPYLGEMSPAVRIVRTNGSVEKKFFCSTDCSEYSLLRQRIVELIGKRLNMLIDNKKK